MAMLWLSCDIKEAQGMFALPKSCQVRVASYLCGRCGILAMPEIAPTSAGVRNRLEWAQRSQVIYQVLHRLRVTGHR